VAGRSHSLNRMNNWASWSDFFSMGGFGLYVWGSYGITLVLLAGEVLMLWKRKRNLKRRENPEIASSDTQFNTSLQGIQ
jgi:heme exporter protein CcmD